MTVMAAVMAGRVSEFFRRFLPVRISGALLPGAGPNEVLKCKEFLYLSTERRRQDPDLPARNNARPDEVDRVTGVVQHAPHSLKREKPEMSPVEQTILFVCPAAGKQSENCRVVPDVRDAAHNAAARLKHRPETLKKILRVCQVLKDIRKNHAVERLRWKWLLERFEIRNENIIESGPRFCGHGGLVLDSCHAAPGGNLLQVPAQSACAASHVED